jgi:hypothetical protein
MDRALLCPFLNDGLGNKLWRVAFAFGLLHRSAHVPAAIVLFRGHCVPSARTYQRGTTYSELDDLLGAFEKRPGKTPYTAVFRERALDEPVLRPGQCLSIRGYFQNIHFLRDGAGLAFVQRIRMPAVPIVPDAAFIHVRTKDYVVAPHLFHLQTYYARAIASMRAHTDALVLFTDDPTSDLVRFVCAVCQTHRMHMDARSQSPTDDPQCVLASMVACAKGGILAPSTLSWWAAFVGHTKHEAASYWMPSHFIMPPDAGPARAEHLAIPGAHVVPLW